MKHLYYFIYIKLDEYKKTITMEKPKEKADSKFDDLVKQLEPLIQQMKTIQDQAVVVYTPLVDDLCNRMATKNEVERMLDWLLMFAGDERMLQLYKKVCKAYWRIYPDSITFYIMEYRKEYDPDSLVGTAYEYLLHEDNETNNPYGQNLPVRRQ